jgi:hypothetical protein
MTDQELETYLRENGYPEHIVRAGKAGLIDRWRRFVEEAERGYTLGLEDYRNDLDIRGILALCGLDAGVCDLDRRFEALLVDRDKRVWESAGRNPAWDFGYPENAGQNLMDDLKAEGVV